MKLRPHTITLQGTKSILRPLTENDWEILARWGSDPEVLWFSEGDNVQAYSMEEVQGIYRQTSQTAFCFMMEVEGRPIGECWLQQMNLARILAKYPGKDCRRIDITIGEKSQWGRGYGTDAIRTLTRFGFEQEQADLIFGCEIADYNPRSRRTFATAGYRVDSRIDYPVGAKARWAYDLVLSKEEYWGAVAQRRTDQCQLR